MRIKSVLAALGIGLAMVLSLDYVSFAATGHSFILGHGNTANSRTVLTRTTPGTTLQLNSRHGWPSLTVNQTAKVSRLNADLLDGLDSSQLARRQHPVNVFVAPALPGRTVSVPVTPTPVMTLPITVPAECGAQTRHTYLLQHEAWWAGSTSLVQLSLTLDSAAQQFGEGTQALDATSYATSASTRQLVLAPGSYTLRLVAQMSPAGTALDPSLRATDLGYSCAGGPTSRPIAGRSPVRMLSTN